MAIAGMSCIAASSHTYASEGQTFGGPIGGTDMRAAYLPPPGWYIGMVLGSGYADRLYGDGQPVPNATAGGSIYLGALGVQYVYPFQVLGGTIASTIQVPYQFGHFSLNQRSEYFSGLGDTYAELIAWSKYLGPIGIDTSSAHPSAAAPYGLTIKLAYSMIVPTGAYSTTQLLTPGHNVYFFIPSIAFSYLTPPECLG
ncbi:hypothetical protein AC629_32310 [Bradyrhizobium sp. NAS80.1]|uniref:transporter n=1 Tax=Bradyrhizobium sp. NAS80.1 TaxID=1680159 RepID=UPI000965169A|nr:transporter [Bradyrhizobium sp. NAS80.1]OKO76963.1 hypothetical protein AC629_32310 [Bradyrhizobium sp. NAS80.1]